MAPRYRVTLTKKERDYLEGISTKGKGLPGQYCTPELFAS